jgi:hypothetical protein
MSGGGGGGGGFSLAPAGGTTVVAALSTLPQVEITYTQPTPAQDEIAPSVLSFGFSHSTFRAARKGGSVGSRAPVGTGVRYRLSEAATARFTVQRANRGRRKGKKCVAPNRGNRHRRRCTRYRRLKGSFSRAGSAGLNSFRFTGRLRRRKLRPGRYRLVMVATDAAGNKSKPKRAKFRVVRR